jgi:endo-1,4-beta-xylanase
MKLFFPVLLGMVLFSGKLLGTDPSAAAATSPLRLWEGPAPGVPENPGEEVQEPYGRVSNVSVPTLDVYLPESGKANGAAIIVCSGGAYGKLATGPLGKGAADIFGPKGFTVFSLKYRLRPPSQDILRDTLADANRAVRLVRSRAQEWNLDPKRIGMVGFSAGSNLILNLACNNTPGDPASPDPVERFSSRPDFIALCCPWPFGRKISMFKIDDKVPPAFIVHAKDDTAAPIAFAEQIEAEWKKCGVPVTFIPYETGNHMGFNFPNAKNGDWTDKFLLWLEERGFVGKP